MMAPGLSAAAVGNDESGVSLRVEPSRARGTGVGANCAKSGNHPHPTRNEGSRQENRAVACLLRCSR